MDSRRGWSQNLASGEAGIPLNAEVQEAECDFRLTQNRHLPCWINSLSSLISQTLPPANRLDGRRDLLLVLFFEARTSKERVAFRWPTAIIFPRWF